MAAFPRAAYYARIGATDTLLPIVLAHEASPASAVPGALGVDFLRNLMLAHLSTIPFENIDALLARPILTRRTEVFDKLIHARRGGYCHEQNALLRAAMIDAGFTHIRTLGARVAMAGEPALVGRAHTMNLVTIPSLTKPGATERWLVDVGTSAGVPMAPLRLDSTASQRTPAGEFRVTAYDLCTHAGMMAAATPAGGHDEGWPEYAMEMLTHSGVWRAVHRFDLQPQYPRDVFVINYVTSQLSTIAYSLRGSRTVVQWAAAGTQGVPHGVGGVACVPRGVYSVVAEDTTRVGTRSLNAYPGLRDPTPPTGELTPLQPSEAHPRTPGELYEWMVTHLQLDLAQTAYPQYRVTREEFEAAARARLAVFGGAAWRGPSHL